MTKKFCDMNEAEANEFFLDNLEHVRMREKEAELEARKSMTMEERVAYIETAFDRLEANYASLQRNMMELNMSTKEIVGAHLKKTSSEALFERFVLGKQLGDHIVRQ